MASYAALVSALHTLNQIKKHPRPPIHVDQKQMDSLTLNLTFFQDFLERNTYSVSGEEEDDELESRIAAAAYATEDVIDSHIVDQIHSGSDIISCTVDLYQGLERVIDDMDSIKKEMMEESVKDMIRVQNKQHPTKSLVRPASTVQRTIAVEFDGVLINDFLDKLTGRERCFQIISIAGMGGIGKTTLARNIYVNPVVAEHFEILVWVTISQEYSVPDIFSQILCEENKGSENKLGVRVRKKLWERRYLIVMDDIWSIEVWDQVKSFFPDNNNGSRVMVTTRLSNLAFDLSGSQIFQMNFLDEDKSWILFCTTVFGKEGCPTVLEDIAKEIARNCRGLPLSIVVIGGLLTKSNMTQTYWEHILKDVSSFINLDNDEYCLQLLRMSYKELPIHLKSCFLYMGIFPEDDEIQVSKLIKLLVAEGILRNNEDKRLEEVAEEYIKELIDRNLILVHQLRWNGGVKLCKMHDLLRDLCLREAKKQRFLCPTKEKQDLNIPECMKMERRICIHDMTTFIDPFRSALLTRSFILHSVWSDTYPILGYRLLRVFSEIYERKDLGSINAFFRNVNLRYLAISLNLPPLSKFPSSWILLWNLQTIKVENRHTSEPITAPSEFWEMLLLRHVMIRNLQLPDPLCGENDLIMEDLQTLSCVTSLKCCEAVIKRIPNIKILKIEYQISYGETEYHKFCLNNFSHLKNLHTLTLDIRYTALFDLEFQRYMGQNLSFPHSLRKLTLSATKFNWEECMTKIGLLPFLEFLVLACGRGWGPEWETVEGQFCSLKFLELHNCRELRYWITEDTHFPLLEHLLLEGLEKLEEIPSSIGDIPTLKSIWLERCSYSAVDSARRLKEEQMELGNLDLELCIDGTTWWGGGEEEENEDTLTTSTPVGYYGASPPLEIQSAASSCGATADSFIIDHRLDSSPNRWRPPCFRIYRRGGSPELNRSRKRIEWRGLWRRCGCGYCFRGRLNRHC